MLKLSDWHKGKDTGVVRCWPVDSVSKFLFKHMDGGVTSHILFFFSEKRGYGDLRCASKERSLEVTLKLRVLRKEMNNVNDDNG